MSRCLAVKKRKSAAQGFDDVVTMSADDYLSRVVDQAARLPEVFVAPPLPPTTSKRPRLALEGSAACVDYLVSRTSITPAPTLEQSADRAWVDAVLADFSRLREYLSDCRAAGVGGKDDNRLPVPALKDQAAWHVFCVGDSAASGNDGSYFDDDDKDEEDEPAALPLPEPAWRANLPPSGYHPTLSLVAQFDQVMVRRVLGHLASYVQQGWSVSSHGQWLYALLAALERPIHRDQAVVLYALLKELAKRRATTHVKDDLASINLLMAVIGVYFEQGGGYATVFGVACDTTK